MKVIWTDVFQLFFMFLSTGYIIVVATQQAGGPAKVLKIILVGGFAQIMLTTKY